MHFYRRTSRLGSPTFEHLLELDSYTFFADFRQEGSLKWTRLSMPNFAGAGEIVLLTLTRSSSIAGLMLGSRGKLKRLAKRIQRKIRSGSSRKVCNGSSGVRMSGESERRSGNPCHQSVNKAS